MTTITIDANFPGGGAMVHKTVLIRLVDGGAGGSASDALIADTLRVTLDASGEGSVELVSNDDITPSGTYYTFTIEGVSPPLERHVEVPASGTYSWADPTIQVTPAPTPPSLSDAAGTAAAAVAAHAVASDPHGDRAYALGLVDDLSGVSDAATARTNLGLGTAATTAATDYATAAQGATADAALPASYLDTDGTLAADSDTKVPSQKAVRTYVASQGSDPIFVTAAASASVDLSSSYDGNRPLVCVVQGTADGTRPDILLGNPSTYVGQVVHIVPDGTNTLAATTGVAAVDNIYGPSVGWDVGATPAVLGDLGAALVAAMIAAKDWDFASTPETFDITVNGTAYTASLSADYTGNLAGLYTAFATTLLTDGFPGTVEAGYLDTYGERILTGALVTTATGSGNTISVTDAGTGDRLHLSTLTATAGAAAAYRGHNNRFDALGELNGGDNTHAWPDTPSTNKTKRLSLVAVASPTPQWVAITTAPRAEDTPITVGTPANWDSEPTNIGQALNELASRVTALEP